MADVRSSVDGRKLRGAQTRKRIIDAATELFPRLGFGGTTVSAIAAAAEVSEPTVYYTFGSKEAVLMAAIDVAVAADHVPVRTLDRDWAVDVVETPDPRRQVQRMVAGAGAILLRAAPLLNVLQQSASMSAEMAGHWAENIRRRREVQQVFVEALATKASLRDGLDVRKAADVSAAFLGPETYGFFTHLMGWSHDAWLAWTSSALTRELLG